MRRREKTIFVVASLMLLALALVACGPAQDPEDEIATATARAQESPADDQDVTPEVSTETETEAEESPVAVATSAPVVSSEEDFDIFAGLGEDAFETTDSGLRYAILEKSDSGERPVGGQMVDVHYTGWLEDGTVFDSSIDTGQPLSFPLGLRSVIPGWDEGIALLEVGDKARLIIPGDLAYGEAGTGSIPPNATLIFDVELVSLGEPPPSPVTVDDSDYETTDSGLKYYDMEVGDGPSPESGQVVTIHFTIWLEDGTFLGSTLSSGQPVQALIGSGQLLEGWEEGLLGMQVGGSRQLIIPPALAFGTEGTPDGVVPPDTNIIMETQLLDVSDPAQ